MNIEKNSSIYDTLSGIYYELEYKDKTYCDDGFKFIVSGEFKSISFKDEFFITLEQHHSLGAKFNLLCSDDETYIYITYNDKYLVCIDDKLSVSTDADNNYIELEQVFPHFKKSDIYYIKNKNRYLNKNMIFTDIKSDGIVLQIDSSGIKYIKRNLVSTDENSIISMNGVNIKSEGGFTIRLAENGEIGALFIDYILYNGNENNIGNLIFTEHPYRHTSIETSFETVSDKTYIKIFNHENNESYYPDQEMKLSINRIDDGIEFVKSKYKGMYFIKDVIHNTYYNIKDENYNFPIFISNTKDIKDALLFQFIHF